MSTNTNIALLLVAMIVWMCGCASSQHTQTSDSAIELLSQGDALAARGQIEQATTIWQRAANAGAGADQSIHANALLRLAGGQIQLGRYDLAISSLKTAHRISLETNDSSLQARTLNQIGVAGTFSPALLAHADHAHAAAYPFPTDVECCFDDALKLARKLTDANLQSAIITNRGNFFVRTAQFDRAKKDHLAAANLAGSGSPLPRARALVNGAIAEFSAIDQARAPDVSSALASIAAARQSIASVPDSIDKAQLLLSIGQTTFKLISIDNKLAAIQSTIARKDYQQSLAIGGQLGDLHTQSFAEGFLGELELSQNNTAAALSHTTRAIQSAQRGNLPDALYRWQWQNARIARAQFTKSNNPADLDRAIRFYESASQTVRFIRNDISLGNGNQPRRTGFRQTIGGLYYEYADVLLRQADLAGNDAAQVATCLENARNTVELLKAAELESYFQDDCVHLLKSKRRDIEDIASFDQTAIVYLIPLEDRTEILVSFQKKQGKVEFARFKVDLTVAQLKTTISRFRAALLNGDDFDEYREPGALLYAKLIAVIEPALTQRGILPATPSDPGKGTLVFVPDGILRTIPMSALFDASHQQHLVERYAIAVSPGLDLMEPKRLDRTNARLLLNGLSEGRAAFKPLFHVPEELNNISAVFASNSTSQLLDKTFTRANLNQKLADSEYSIVHIASHAYFGANAADSKLLTYDRELGLDDIQALIGRYQLRDKPVELLMLSACQTAEGDDKQERAALGLAGIAVKAGARSAIATLWSVNDRATSILVTGFYRQFITDPTLSKAQALARAQRAILADPRLKRYGHPHFWASFIVIGNWL